MVSSKAATVADYLAELPPERRAVIQRALDFVRRNIPDGYEESMMWGMVCWSVPLSRYPDTYNRQPLCYAALAAQKSFYALYLNASYTDEATDERLRKAYAAAGRKLDMGKSCLRFKAFDDLLLPAVAEVLASMDVPRFLAGYEASRRPAAKAKRHV